MHRTLRDEAAQRTVISDFRHCPKVFCIYQIDIDLLRQIKGARLALNTQPDSRPNLRKKPRQPVNSNVGHLTSKGDNRHTLQ